MKKIIFAAALVLSASGHIHGQDIITAPTLRDLSSVAGKKNDFGMSFNLGVEKKLAPGLSLDIDGEYRTQDNSSMTERWVLGASLSYRLYRTFDKKFSLKAGAGFEYMWRQKAAEKECFDKISQHYDDDDGLFDGYTQRKGYKNTSAYWRNRHRTSAFLSATYAPSKRWSFTLKETFQFNHYCSTSDSIPRTRTSEEYYKWREYETDDATGVTTYYDANRWGINGDGDFYERADAKQVPFTEQDDKAPRSSKDKLVLRSKLTVKYNVRGIPLNPYVSVDYGCGLNYHANKWKYTAGADYTINKQHKIDCFYRFTHEDGEDDPDGHMIGIGYKYSF